MQSNRRLHSPPGQTVGLARGSDSLSILPLHNSRCEHGVLALVPWGGRDLGRDFVVVAPPEGGAGFSSEHSGVNLAKSFTCP